MSPRIVGKLGSVYGSNPGFCIDAGRTPLIAPPNFVARPDLRSVNQSTTSPIIPVSTFTCAVPVAKL